MVGGVGSISSGMTMPVVQRLEAPAKAPPAGDGGIDPGAAQEQAMAVLDSAVEAYSAAGDAQIALLREGLDIGRTMTGQLISMIDGVKAYVAGSGGGGLSAGSIDIIA